MSTAVSVRAAYKKYKVLVLSGLDMDVPKGSIYGLLGPSGCGKTTLLSCIVGSKALDSGSIEIPYTSTTQIGYMPQEIALNEELTIGEVLMFYGRLHGMESGAVARKAAELVTFLELPSQERRISICSGGQQRRVSLAVTILHDPELLILDEPTVGVDPLLSQSIWEMFVRMARVEKKTIIITTHYIEEARQATVIGLMRGGVLLAEEAPAMLMERHDCQSLEQVFLLLSQKQVSQQPQQPQQDNSQEGEVKKKVSRPLLTQGRGLKLHRVRAQLSANYSWTMRNLAVTLFVLLLPPMNMLVCRNLDLNNMSSRPLAVVNHESCEGQHAAQHDTEEQRVQGKLCHQPRPLSCVYIHLISQKFTIVDYPDVDSGVGAVEKNRAVAVLHFPANFSHGLLERLEEQMEAGEAGVEAGTLEVRADMSSYLQGYQIMMDLYASMENMLAKICLECGLSVKFAKMPLQVEAPVFGDFTGRYIDTVIPAYMSTLLFYTTFVYTSSALLMEKTSGVLERSRIAGLTIKEVLAAHMITQTAVITVENILSLTVLYSVAPSPMHGSWLVVYISIIQFEVLGVFYGALVAMVLPKESLVSYVGIGTIITAFTICGTMWPQEGMHWGLWWPSRLVPLTTGVESYSDHLLRGHLLTHPRVLPGFLSMTAGCAALAAACFLVYKKGYAGL